MTEREIERLEAKIYPARRPLYAKEFAKLRAEANDIPAFREDGRKRNTRPHLAQTRVRRTA
jgi:hypothetical protein